METRNQTAVEWFLAELLKDGARNISLDGLAALTDEALAMENEQRADAYYDGYHDGYKEAESYYVPQT